MNEHFQVEVMRNIAIELIKSGRDAEQIPKLMGLFRESLLGPPNQTPDGTAEKA